MFRDLFHVGDDELRIVVCFPLVFDGDAVVDRVRVVIFVILNGW